MNINELDSYRLADAVKFHNRLNPRLWDSSEHLHPEVREKLLQIAADFQEFLGVSDLEVKDITLSGSNAAYSYTPHSDIDLHLVVDQPGQNDEIYQELFNAKKYQYNDMHDIRIKGADVELYVQPSNQSPVSLGEYSVLNNNWIQAPRRKRARINQTDVKAKYEDIKNRIEQALKDDDAERIDHLVKKIKEMRQAGLAQHGEFGPENLAFKMLRSQGAITQLYDALAAAKDQELSLAERLAPSRRRWGFVNEVGSTPDGVSPETKMFLSEEPTENLVQDFIQDTARRLGIENMPEIIIHSDPEWSEQNRSFGMFVPEEYTLHVSLHNRHILDILRTTAHELAHCRQHEIEPLQPDAGDTGSEFENEAHAVAGIIMRDYADQHPERFDDAAIAESSGYIPTNAQKNDSRFVMALTADVRPGQTGKEANKMRLATDAQGHPQLLRANGRVNMVQQIAENLRKELALLETELLGEVKMTSQNLSQLAKQIPGVTVGLEFEMIVPNTNAGDDDDEMEPDYDQDERVRDIDDAVNFFDDGDYNHHNEISRLRERMESDYFDWQSEQIEYNWDQDGLEFFQEYLEREDPFDDEDAEMEARNELQAQYGDEISTEDFEKMLFAVVDEKRQSYVQDQWDEQGRNYDNAREEFSDEKRDEDAFSERDWLDSAGINYASDVENSYQVSWPHWTSSNNSDETDIKEVALDFMNAMGYNTIAVGQYHGYGGGYELWNGDKWVNIGSNKPLDAFTIEPDGSLSGNDGDDAGLEFVSPPIPLEKIGDTMAQVQAWAGSKGVYTGKKNKTSIHTNISIPGYNIDKLDYLKAALLLGDEYVLREFDRVGNTYAKPAIDKIKDLVGQKPEKAQELLDKMKSHLNAEASKLIHSGITDKFTSINTKDNRIEFRSPGGDYLDIIANNPQKMMDTINRMVVAMDAAMDPEKYKQEYQKKLYKMLTGQASGREAATGAKQETKADDKDLLNIFSRYAAGELPREALKSFVKQAQLERKVERDKTSGEKMWWKVSNPPHSLAGIEVVATSKEEAIEKALGADGYPSWANTRQTIVAKPVRPFEDTSLDKPFVWKVIGRSDSPYQSQGIEVTASSKTEAMKKARQQWDLNTSGATEEEFFRTNGWRATPVRPAEDANAVTLNGRPSNPDGNWFLKNSDTDEIIYRFNAVNYQDAYTVLQQWKEAHPGDENIVYGKVMGSGQDTPQTDVNPLRPTGPGPWEVASRSNNQVYYNPEHTNRGAAETEARTWLIQNGHNPNEFEVRTREGVSQTTDQAQGGIIDIEPDIEQYFAPGSTTDLAQQRAQGGFTGAWKVMNVDTGEELYRFSGVGNVQSDANGVALAWIRSNAPNTDLVQIEVVPIMGNA